jgi:hypothetical protein
MCGPSHFRRVTSQIVLALLRPLQQSSPRAWSDLRCFDCSSLDRHNSENTCINQSFRKEESSHGMFAAQKELCTKGPPCDVITPRAHLPSRNLSLFATENSAGKRFGEAGDRAGIFGDAGRSPAAETALSRVSGGKAAESQRLFRSRQEGDVSQEQPNDYGRG